MSQAFVRASYAIIPMGLAGVVDGIYQGTSGSPALGAVLGIVGLAAAVLAVTKLRAGQHWPFA
jgi:hypothetical protein